MSQLSLFATRAGVVATAVLPHKPTTPKVSKPRYDVEQEGEYYHVWPVGSNTYLGYIYHIGGKMWGLYFAGERGVCGFGGPDQQRAAAELHACFVRKGKGLEV
jgi:hypothetical protein